jgi:putative ABC transport system substrate-binding protein
MMMPMRRRDFIALLGGAAASWPLAVRAQQPARMRRIGVLWPYPETDPEGQLRMAALRQGLQELGWTEGRNLRIDYRWGGADYRDSMRRNAAELVALAPDVIVAGTGGIVRELQRASRTVPIVFPGANDPVGAGLVESLARPGGNATGFASIEYSMGGKFLELLKEIAPRVTRAAVIRDLGSAGGIGFLGAIQTAAVSLRVEVRPLDVRDDDVIERGVMAFAREPNGGLVVLPSALVQIHRELIITLAARHRLPAIYPGRAYAAGGGLISYGAVFTDVNRRAAGYVDRILKGEKPADLPVQMPTRYETVLNLKTAKTLGLEVPTSVLLRADEVIE